MLTIRNLVAVLACALAVTIAGSVASARVITGYGGLDGVDYDCWDFATQYDAQNYFVWDGGSVYNNADNLDPNRDGYACASGDFGY